MTGEIPVIQALPTVRARWRRDADVVVVGSGAAGISAALTAAERGLRVLMVTKDLIGGATPLAQGGLAAAIGPLDSVAAHVEDTVMAGAGLCEPAVVTALASGAPGAIEWLARLGARLETWELRLEGGHSARRIVHSGDDATGAEVHRVLLAALLASGIEILDRTAAIDLILRDADGTEPEAGGRRLAPIALKVQPPGAGQTFSANESASGGLNPAGESASGGLNPAGEAACGGLNPAGGGRAGIGTGRRAVDGTAAANADPDGGAAQKPIPARQVAGLVAAVIGPDGRLEPGVIDARAVVIAAGGVGQAFATTSNPAGATGDGIALAARAGAVLRDLEFVQFHPTVLWLPGASGQSPLITEALRGAGAVLRDLDGTPLMAGQDPRGDLAPRDVVAARMAEVIGTGPAGHVWLDATRLGREVLENGFPTVTAACRKHGIDPVTGYIPVAPGAHYSCGGVLADLDGRTSIPGLYAVGEAASTGVQGANRLASNSVTEAIIAGRRAGESLSHLSYLVTGLREGASAGRNDAAGPEAAGRGSVAEGRRGLAEAMSRWAGVMRDAEGLGELVRAISGADVEGGEPAGPVQDHLEVEPLESLESLEAGNLRTVSALIAAGALRRAESRGCHRRRDAAGRAERPWHTLQRWDGRELVVTEEEL